MEVGLSDLFEGDGGRCLLCRRLIQKAGAEVGCHILSVYPAGWRAAERGGCAHLDDLASAHSLPPERRGGLGRILDSQQVCASHELMRSVVRTGCACAGLVGRGPEVV